MDNLPFFTDNNKDLLYNLCRDEIYKESQYNIDNNKKYYKTFGEIMKIVYKHSKNVNDLTQLNKEVLSKTIPYLKKEIQKKQLKNSALLPPQLNPMKKNDPNLNKNNLPVSFRAESTQNQNVLMESVSDSYNKILDNRDQMFKAPPPPEINFNQEMGNYESANKLMEQTLQNRKDMNSQFNIPDNTISTLNNQFKQNVNQGIDNNLVQSNNSEPQNLNESRGMMPTQNTEVNINNVENMEVQDFSISDETIRNLHNNPISGPNLMNTYDEKNNDVDPQILLKKYQEENSKQDSEFQNINNSMIDFADRNKEENLNLQIQKDQRDLQKNLEEQSFRDSLTFKIDQQMNNLSTQNIKGQFDHRIESKEIPSELPTANDLNAIQSNNLIEENRLFEELKKKLFKERSYVNKENLVIINSVDRDWFNEASQNRYSFQVRFNPESDGIGKVPKIKSGTTGEIERNSDGSIIYVNQEFKGDQGAGIQNIFKNIVSFELVRVLMPVENFIIPFDERIFVDYKSLPYIVLNIEEIEGIYGGTNSNTNNAFAQLLWDKDHSSEIISNESELNGEKKVFSRQLKRGFSSMAPLSFEKKTFYPTPLSSLNRLTISLETPYGKNINSHPDTLDIIRISLVNVDKSGFTYQLKAADGFPNISDNRKIIQIRTNTYFSNRVFKIGDNVKFKGFVSTQSDSGLTNDFINRNEGHYIINLEQESVTNSGYINTLYISPPGEFTSSSTTLEGVVTNKASLDTLEEVSDDVEVTAGLTTISNIVHSNALTELEKGDGIFLNKTPLPPFERIIDSVTDGDNVEVTDASDVNTVDLTDQILKRYRRDYYKYDSGNFTVKMVNTSLQTHFVFKIVTREEDIHSHMISSNI